MKIKREHVEYSGNTQILSKEYDITNIELICDILSNMYSDPISAVIREYVANGLDSHKMAGKSDVPLKIVMPTRNYLYFEVHDFGMGMSEEQVDNLWSTYGGTDKNETNELIGGFGIGSKAGFSYTQSFQVQSIYNGVKSFYQNVKIDKKPHIEKISEMETDECNGVSIIIPVNINDIDEFYKKAENILKWLDTKPNIIGMELKSAEFEILEDDYGILKRQKSSDYTRDVYIKMGEVVYQTNIENYQIERDIVLFYDIGAFNVSPDRENIIIKPEDVLIIRERIENIFQRESERLHNSINTKSMFVAAKLHRELSKKFAQRVPFNWKGKENKTVYVGNSLMMKGRRFVSSGNKRYQVDNINYIYDIEGCKKGYVGAFQHWYDNDLNYLQQKCFGNINFVLVIDSTKPMSALKAWLAAGRPEVEYIRYSDIKRDSIKQERERSVVQFKQYNHEKETVFPTDIDLNDKQPHKYVNISYNKFMGLDVQGTRSDFHFLVLNAGIRENIILCPATLKSKIPAHWVCVDEKIKSEAEEFKRLVSEEMKVECYFLKSNSYKFDFIRHFSDRKIKGTNLTFLKKFLKCCQYSNEEIGLFKKLYEIFYGNRYNYKVERRVNNIKENIKINLRKYYPLAEGLDYLDSNSLQYIDLMNKHVYNIA